MSRILITGGPRTGKTTMAATFLGHRVRSTDDLIGKLDWSAASEEVARWLDEPGHWVIEGVAVPRALRKWLAAKPGKPADRIIYLGRPWHPLTGGQLAMTRGLEKVWREVEGMLMGRGVDLQVLG